MSKGLQLSSSLPPRSLHPKYRWYSRWIHATIFLYKPDVEAFTTLKLMPSDILFHLHLCTMYKWEWRKLLKDEMSTVWVSIPSWMMVIFVIILQTFQYNWEGTLWTHDPIIIFTVISSTELLLTGPTPAVESVSSLMILAIKLWIHNFLIDIISVTKNLNKSTSEFTF